MSNDTYNNIIKWTGRAAHGITFFITIGLTLMGLCFIGIGLMSMVFFDSIKASALLGSGSICFCVGSLALVWQLREHATKLRRAYVSKISNHEQA